MTDCREEATPGSRLGTGLHRVTCFLLGCGDCASLQELGDDIALLVAAIVFGVVHLLFQRSHRRIQREYTNQIALDDDEEDFPMKLGLSY